jgi:ubiquitin-protein ligase
MEGHKQQRGPHHQQRLLHDVKEMMTKPYPNIRLFIDESDLNEACLVLTPDGYDRPLHFTVNFCEEYPVHPPMVSIQSRIEHPNIFGAYICASVLKRHEGYTPAYTLQGIALQLLSFFGSDTLDQEGNWTANLANFKAADKWSRSTDQFKCRRCTFPDERCYPQLTTSVKLNEGRAEQENSKFSEPIVTPADDPTKCHLARLPDELLLLTLENMEFEELTMLAAAWPRVSQLITSFNLMQQRDIRCFVLKKGYGEAQLGIGTNITGGRQGRVESEFEFISKQAFHELGIRRSIHGRDFQHWLPLPVNPRHWSLVRADAGKNLMEIQKQARVPGHSTQVIFNFMNNVVVRLNEDLSRGPGQVINGYHSSQGNSQRSTLAHASERAIEAYFHLFHLLLCMATSDFTVVRAANRMLEAFMSGKTSKNDVPNLGYLLIALLISDVEVTVPLMKAIITEAITRNVVWLLDARGAGMAELAHMEEDNTISEYRLKRTFEGSRTSYRLLMFTELFRRTARPNSDKASLATLRDELFQRHGAPPPGAAARLASEVRRLQTINDFPNFLQEMGIPIPGRLNFCQLLRRTVRESMGKGYSRWAMTQPDLYHLRRARETGAPVPSSVRRPREGQWFQESRSWSGRASDRSRW